jgi:hypothetical protein
VADYGQGNHSFGSPSDGGLVRLDLEPNGVITGKVFGTLYWDALLASGCAVLEVEWQDVHGHILHTGNVRVCGPGGNANANENHSGEGHLSFSNVAVWKIKLSTGTLVMGTFRGVKSTSVSFGKDNVETPLGY